mmetsp:Transcript_22926/g.38357  ORF Transcript_22926/g.38357 Transcript_22926/m.38357 type:complete len:159 (-) Transcript_22926:1112-1588(-)
MLEDWSLTFWVVSFLVEAALLGIIMYTLICLADLENDFMNPHDSASRINKCVLPEYIMQATQVFLFIVGGKWALLALSILEASWMARTYLKGHSMMDVTEIFNELPKEKKVRLMKLFIHLLMFIVIIYRVVEAAVGFLMDTHGPAISHTIMSNMARAR